MIQKGRKVQLGVMQKNKSMEWKSVAIQLSTNDLTSQESKIFDEVYAQRS